MTREMNKPDWCNYNGECNWWQTNIKGVCSICPNYKPKQRTLNPDIAEFFYKTNERLK